MVQLDPAEKDVAIEEVRRFVAEIFSGHRQLNVPFEAKSRRLKSLRKEPDKAKIILLLFFHLVRDRILLGTAGGLCVSDAEAWRSPVRAQDGSERVLRFRFRSEVIQRRKNASCTQMAKQRNKVFIIKGRGSSVVEQPIRNRFPI